MENLTTIYQYFQRVIAAGEVARINVYGNFITLLSNTGSANIRISIGGQSFQELPFGLSVELPQGDNFTYLEFQNTEGAAVTIAFSLSSGRINDARLVLNGVVAVNLTTNALSTPAAITVNTAAPGAATIAANTSRRTVIIQNNGANPIWAGDSAVDGASNRGILIPIGDTLVLDSEAAIYLRATGAASTASIMELTK